MPKMVVQLSETQISKAKPKDKQYKMADGGGLYLLVTTTGGKLWRLKYRFANKEKMLSFGIYPALYMRLQRFYWKNCGKVPDDLDLLCRAARVSSSSEKSDVEMILESFFIRDREMVRHAELDKRYKDSTERYVKTSEAGKKAVAAREQKRQQRLQAVSIDTSNDDQARTRTTTTIKKRTKTESKAGATGDEQPVDSLTDMMTVQEFRRLYKQTTIGVLNKNHDGLVEKICRVIPRDAIEYIFCQSTEMGLDNESDLMIAFNEMYKKMQRNPS